MSHTRRVSIKHPTQEQGIIVVELPLTPKFPKSTPVSFIKSNSTKRTQNGYQIKIPAFDLIGDLQELEGSPESEEEIVKFCQDVLYNIFNKQTPLVIHESNEVKRKFIIQAVQELSMYMMLPLTVDQLINLE